MPLPNASIIVTTFNRANTLKKTLRGILSVDYSSEFEMIVVNDASSDNTKKMLAEEFGKNKKIKIINFSRNSGVCKARNAGIKEAKYPIIVNMDHDCYPAKDWLKTLVKPFSDPKVGISTSYGGFGGTSTAFRKEVVERIGGYDEDYFYYREDTDLAFKIIEAGYDIAHVNAAYQHDHLETKPRDFIALAKYVFQRLKYHQNDVLLYKKHPNELTKRFLDIKFGFIVNPIADFNLATGRWRGKGGFEASSPRGISLIKNKSPLHFLLIILAGIGYMLALKLTRLYASIKFGKLLI